MGSSSVTKPPTPNSSSPNSSTELLGGLKFGQKIYFENVGLGSPAKSGGSGASSSSSGTKKGRSGAVQRAQPPRCQVEGCKVDLTDAKAYYSRHKVCGMHSKSPRVIVAGLEQRFCQQCSRFCAFFLISSYFTSITLKKISVSYFNISIIVGKLCLVLFTIVFSGCNVLLPFSLPLPF